MSPNGALFPGRFKGAREQLEPVIIGATRYLVNAPIQQTPPAIEVPAWLPPGRVNDFLFTCLPTSRFYTTDAGQDKLRTELQSFSSTRYPNDVDVWLSFQQIVLQGDPLTSNFCVIGQWHNVYVPAVGYAVSPPLAINLYGGLGSAGYDRWNIRTVASTDPAANPGTVSRYVNNLHTRGRWRSHVARMRFNPFQNGDGSFNGEIEWWTDGAKVVELVRRTGTAIPMGTADNFGYYFQFGIYRASTDFSVPAQPVTGTLQVRYRNVEVGTDSLYGRIQRPLP